MPSSAQQFPNKPVKVVVGYSAGGAVDAVARAVGQAMSVSLGQPFVVDNKPGAGTNIAVKYVIGSEPDGYTLMMAANALAANMALYQPAPFDAERDLVPVSLIGRVPVVLAANINAPYGTIAQLLAAAKAKPGTIAFATPGNGSTPHMALEFFERAAGIDLQHVPYRGGSQALTDVIGGQIAGAFADLPIALPQIRAGKVKALGLVGMKRSGAAPEIPTIEEQGVLGVDGISWFGVLAPGKTPPEVVKRISDAVAKALSDPELKQRLQSVGSDPTPTTPEETVKLIQSDQARWAKIIAERKITVQ